MEFIDLKEDKYKRWDIKKHSEEKVKAFCKRYKQYKASEVLAKYCLNRKIDDYDRYTKADFEGFHNPFLFRDMKKSVERINQAIEKGEKILVYGDYDVDGITATSYLYLYLKQWHADVEYFIPRREDGYGITKASLDRCFFTRDGAGQESSSECGMSQCGTAKESNSQGNSAQNGTVQEGAAQIGAAQIGANQESTVQNGANQESPSQGPDAQIGVGQETLVQSEANQKIPYQECERKNYSLMITVDCGITAVDEVEMIREMGCDVIVTDHHTSKEELPRAFAMITTTVGAEEYPYRHLCGAGVAMKLVQAMCIYYEIPEDFLDRIELVALGTVADVVSLTGENRLIVQMGLDRLRYPENMGMRCLLEEADIEAMLRREINTTTLGFAVGPRINAAGRMENARIAAQLFTTQDGNEVKMIAKHLSKLNQKRQEEERRILEQASEEIESVEHYATDKVLVLAGKGWRAGVIGIVASRIAEKYYKPTIVISLDDGKGSCRSIKGFDMFEALTACKDDMIGFGGHAPAAGLSILEENIPVLREHLNSFVEERYTDDLYVEKLLIDGELRHEEINLKIAMELENCQPYGMGNSQGVWMARDVLVSRAELIGKDKKHLKICFKLQDNSYVDAVGFNMADRLREINMSERIDVVFKLSLNWWKRSYRLQLIIVDVRCDPITKLTYAFERSLKNVFALFAKAPNAPLQRKSAQQELFARGRGTLIVNSEQDIKTVVEILKGWESQHMSVRGEIYCNQECIFYMQTQNSEKYDIIVDIVINPSDVKWKENIIEPCLVSGIWLNQGYKDKVKGLIEEEGLEMIDCSMMGERKEEYAWERKDLISFYSHIAHLSEWDYLDINTDALISHFEYVYKIKCNFLKLQLALEALREEGLINYSLNWERTKIKMVRIPKKRNDILMDSRLLKKIQEL